MHTVATVCDSATVEPSSARPPQPDPLIEAALLGVPAPDELRDRRLEVPAEGLLPAHEADAAGFAPVAPRRVKRVDARAEPLPHHTPLLDEGRHGRAQLLEVLDVARGAHGLN